ncbi:efflux RND transporter periplasmic adaptor subunit [Crassaminicella profunda]|uniref:efflux RND transporter periplasmic adaptor subunit n=1 Tax=Crassaminicella profunda TaxID=1286698 RepID=UPI001CA61AFE|nr:efflux RND transporter periplasmic adaptor subunit [Crassaminicella profunda]QZY54265.1 efflux RND transporter periplasmic adaptor subunit [Crassaminicella profunda]
MLKGKKKKLLIIVTAIVVIAFIGFGTVKASKKEKNPGMSVQTVEINKQDIESHIQATGQILSMDKREIVSDVEEKIEKMLVEKGQKVEKGQVLMELEKTNIDYKIKEAKGRLEIEENTLAQLKTDLEIDLSNAEIKYKDALDTYERNKKLYEANALSKSELDDSKNTLDEMHNQYVSAEKKLGDGENTGEIAKQKKQIKLTQLQLEKAKDDLEKYSIKSPITGTIVDMKISESGIIENHVVLMYIQDVDHLEIVTEINEYDASKMKLGDCVKISGDAFEGKEYKGKVKYVGPFAKTVETGRGKENVVEIKVAIEDIDEYLKPGFSAKMDILTESKKDVYVLPYETIFTKKNGDQVIFVVKNGKVKEQKIEMGIESDLEVEVIGKGLKEKDKVIMNPTENIKDGDSVNENQVM